MSHFAAVQVDFQQKNEKDLVAALEKQFGEGTVEVHEDGAALMGYGGDNRANLPQSNKNWAPPCHIIIRRRHVGSASNDVGYRRTEDGKYVAYVSDYDSSTNFGKNKQAFVAKEYSLSVAERKLKAEGWTTKRVTNKETGKVQIQASKWTK